MFNTIIAPNIKWSGLEHPCCNNCMYSSVKNTRYLIFS